MKGGKERVIERRWTVLECFCGADDDLLDIHTREIFAYLFKKWCKYLLL